MIRPVRPDLPTGTVTFLFTDVEGSTRLLYELGAEAYAEALAEHRRVVRDACSAEGGVEVDTQGDALFFVFPTAPGALAAAAVFTDALAGGRISVRVGLHTGTPLLAEEGYVGDDVHLGARVAAAGHGGQVVFTRNVAALLAPSDTVSQGLSLTDLGEHRLKDIHEPVALFQLGEESFPPLKTISNTNLPRPASSFLGREAELGEVLSRIENGARLVTLTGPGGTGKTRLALEAAATLVPRYKAGVFWVGLASLRDAALVSETIAQVLGAKDGLATHIGEREPLLLLDNLEQIVECAPALSELLQACPNLTLLCTSRELLRIQGEVEYPVPPLAESEAVSLFCVRSGLEPSEEITELCAGLDSLPLAVELAAARTRALTPAQIVERLSQRLDLLKGGRDSDARQQTLRMTIEWSYELLSHEEQQLFARLSVFAGGCTLEAAEEVADADLDTLQSLVEKSLLRFTPSESGGRYWMLETIREYAGERLEEDEADIVREKHLDQLLRLAESAEADLWAQQSNTRLAQLDAEEANFRGALAWAIRERDERAVRLAGSLYPFWELRGQHKEARSWLAQALALDGGSTPQARAKALVGAGRATARQFDWPVALDLLEEAASLSRKLDDAEGVGRCLGFIGHARLFTGDSAGAMAVLNEGVELARSTGDREGLGRALYNAAFASIERRDFVGASAILDEAADIAQAQGMRLIYALSRLQRGYTSVLAGEYALAAVRLDESLNLLEDLGKTVWSPVAQRYQALLALLDARVEDAESLLRASLAEGREEAPQQEVPNWIEDLAAVASAKGEARRAATLWGATDGLFETRRLVLREENRQVRKLFRANFEEFLDTDAYAQGRAMTLEEAVNCALEDEPARA